MNITRHVISDLWPLYSTGEASADTRALVDEFLATDPECARTLQESSRLNIGSTGAPALPPEVELQALSKTRLRLTGYAWLLRLAMLFSALAFGRIVSDTSWDVSPRNFIVMASIAFAFWIAFFVSLYRIRARILVVGQPRK